uniref:Uncharacterized protein n=1 Tax=Anopheles atroparvus TaxID=41427 RepID=A0A182J265_ANOAO
MGRPAHSLHCVLVHSRKVVAEFEPVWSEPADAPAAVLPPPGDEAPEAREADEEEDAEDEEEDEEDGDMERSCSTGSDVTSTERCARRVRVDIALERNFDSLPQRIAESGRPGDGERGSSTSLEIFCACRSIPGLSRTSQVSDGFGLPPSLTQASVSSEFSFTGMNMLPASSRRESIKRTINFIGRPLKKNPRAFSASHCQTPSSSSITFWMVSAPSGSRTNRMSAVRDFLSITCTIWPSLSHTLVVMSASTSQFSRTVSCWSAYTTTTLSSTTWSSDGPRMMGRSGSA